MNSAKIVKVHPLNPKEEYLKEAARIVREGGLVIIPTETVYGIAANMLDKRAVARVYEIKKRPLDKPFSVHIERKEILEEFALNVPTNAYKLIDTLWPGPLTVVLKAKDIRSHTGERLQTIGLRMPDHEVALQIIKLSCVPVVCPSANLSGMSAPRNFEDALKDLRELVDYAIDAGSTKYGMESTVVDLTQEPLRILREGALKSQDIEKVVRKKVILFVCTGNSCRSVMAKALLEKKLKEKNRADVEVLSAGIMMLSGMGATEPTKQLLRREGIDVSGHRSQKVNEMMIKKSDLILIMEKMHEERVLELVPQAKNKVFLLKEFAKISDNNLNIEDPISRPEHFYENIFAIIKEAVERVAELI